MIGRAKGEHDAGALAELLAPMCLGFLGEQLAHASAECTCADAGALVGFYSGHAATADGIRRLRELSRDYAPGDERRAAAIFEKTLQAALRDLRQWIERRESEAKRRAERAERHEHRAAEYLLAACRAQLERVLDEWEASQRLQPRQAPEEQQMFAHWSGGAWRSVDAAAEFPEPTQHQVMVLMQLVKFQLPSGERAELPDGWRKGFARALRTVQEERLALRRNATVDELRSARAARWELQHEIRRS